MISIVIPVSLILSYKLLRLNTVVDLPYSGYIVVLASCTPIWLLYLFSYFYKDLMRSGWKLTSIKAIYLILVLSTVATVYRGEFDTYTVALLCILSFFFLTNIFSKIPINQIKGVLRLVFWILTLITLFEIVSHILYLKYFDYFKYKNLNFSTLSTFHPLFQFRGRPPGISGSVYATSALISAISVYAIREKLYVLAVISLIVVLLLATASTLVILVLVLMFSVNIIGLLVLLPMMIYFIGSRIEVSNTLSKWMPNWSSIEIDMVEFIFGFASHTHSSNFGEFRVFDLMLSFGLINSILVGYLFHLIRIKISNNSENDTKIFLKNLFLFVSMIFLCNWHYQTFMVYPNILIVLALIAVINAKVKNYRSPAFVQ